VNLTKLILSTNGFVGVLLINKLFELGYNPNQLMVWCSSADDNRDLKRFCRQYLIEVTDITTVADMLTVVNADLLLSVSGVDLLLPNYILDQFKFGGINLHTADSQKYRGRWMVSWCLINNESTVGYTWHRMNEKFDTGNILLQHFFDILPIDTAFSLNIKIRNHAINQLDTILSDPGQYGTTPATNGRYYSKKVPFDGLIADDWNTDQIEKFIRAMYCPPHQPAKIKIGDGHHLINNIEEYYAIKNMLVKKN
jgi:methionyl-tRNA formyltransferase